MDWPKDGSPKIAYAEYYIANGYAIFPLLPGEKTPAISKFDGGQGV